MKYKFPGTTIREKQTGPFRLTETAYSRNVALPLHEHQTAYLSFLLAGGYQESYGNREMYCSGGTVMWHPPNDAHADCFAASGAHMLNLEVSDAWLEEASQELKPHADIRAFRHGLPFTLGLRLYRQLLADGSETADLAFELISFFFNGRADCQPPHWFTQVLELTREAYGGPLSLAEAAQQVGVHPVHLARSFRRFLGCTFGDHIAKLRIGRAFELLLGSGLSIADVAYASGFADHAHLSRSFKEASGLTPTAFLLQCRTQSVRRRALVSEEIEQRPRAVFRGIPEKTAG